MSVTNVRRGRSSGNAYDVFISHAGEDKEILGIPLHRELKKRGVRPFLDLPELRVGENASAAIVRAMETSPMGLFLLSPEFAAKNWPMKELKGFMARYQSNDIAQDEKPILIPVFFRLSAQDCKDRLVHKKYGHVFGTTDFLQRMEDNDTSLKDVLNNLAQVAQLTGIECNPAHSATSEAPTQVPQELIEKICDAVCERLPKEDSTSSSSYIPRTVSPPPSTASVEEYVYDGFTPSFGMHKFENDVHLHVERKGVDGRPCTTEGRLLHKVLEHKHFSGDTNVVALLGRAGSGKSTILRNMVHDERVQHRFPGGAYHISLGTQADEAFVVTQLSDILKSSGGASRAKYLDGSVDSMKMVGALNTAQAWFRGLRCLLCVSDYCNNENFSLAAVKRLRQIFSPRSCSVLLVSTRSKLVSTAADDVEYCSSEPLSWESRALLLSYAKQREADLKDSKANWYAEKILRHCNGLPFCLVLAGSGVAELAQHYGHSNAWAMYDSILITVRVTEAENKMSACGGCPEAALILAVALVILEDYRYKRMRFQASLSILEMFRAMAVLPANLPIPLATFQRLWKLSSVAQTRAVVNAFADLVLVQTASDPDPGRETVQIHDLVHGYAQNESICKEEMESFHLALLQTTRVDDVLVEEDDQMLNSGNIHWATRIFNGFTSQEIFERTRRDSFTSMDDCYMLDNVSRHIAGSANPELLIELLADVRWLAILRFRNRLGVWMKGFEHCSKAIQSGEFRNRQKESLLEGVRLIRDVVWNVLKRGNSFEERWDGNASEICQREEWSESWHENYGSFPDGFAYEIYARLQDIDDRLWPAVKFRESVGEWQRRLWLKPLHGLWPYFGDREEKELFLETGVSDVALPDSRDYAVVAVGRDVRTVDLESGAALNRFKGHEDVVTCVEVTADGSLIVSGSWDGTLRKWDPPNGLMIGNPLSGHQGGITCMCLSPCEKRIVSGSTDCTLRVWDTSTGRQLDKPLRGHKGEVTCVAMSANGETLISGSWDCTLRVWSMTTGSVSKKPLRGHAGGVQQVVIDNRGKFAVSCALNDNARWWDLEFGRQLNDDEPGNITRVSCMALCPNNETLLLGSAENDLHIRWFRFLEKRFTRFIYALRGTVEKIAVTADGKHAVSGSSEGSVQVWRVPNDERTENTTASDPEPIQVVISSTGRLFASVSNEDVQVWDAIEGIPVGKPLVDHEGAVTCVAFRRDERILVSAGYDQTIRIWDYLKGEAIGRAVEVPATPRSVAISPDGDMIVWGDREALEELAPAHGTLRVWSISSGGAVGQPQPALWSDMRIEIPSNSEVKITYEEDRDQQMWKLDKSNGLHEPFLVVDDESSSRGESRGDGKLQKLVTRRDISCYSNGVYIQGFRVARPHWYVTAWDFHSGSRLLVTALENGQIIRQKVMGTK